MITFAGFVPLGPSDCQLFDIPCKSGQCFVMIHHGNNHSFGIHSAMFVVAMCKGTPC